jgi:hypothetical protein
MAGMTELKATLFLPTVVFPFSNLANVNQPKDLAASKVYHTVIIIKLCMNRMP